MKKLEKILNRVERKMASKPNEKDYNWRAQFLEQEVRKLCKEVKFLKQFIDEREGIIDSFEGFINFEKSIEITRVDEVVASKALNGNILAACVSYPDIRQLNLYKLIHAFASNEFPSGVAFALRTDVNAVKCLDSDLFRDRA